MTENYHPPRHPMVIIRREYYDHIVLVVPDGYEQGRTLRELLPDEAISLGLALMENGLHLKAQIKNSQTAQGGTDANHERNPE